MAARFDFANQELRIARLRAEELRRNVEVEQAQTRFERTIFSVAATAVAAVIGLLAWALVTVKRSRDEVRAANDGLAETNVALGKALAAKTEFLATTSHEIRTPLNGILGMTQVMLADRKIASDVRERLGVVHAAGTSMRALVDDILDAAKVETGNLTIERAPFDLCRTLQGATELWEAQCRAKGLGFHVELDGCPAMLMGDAARVRQVVSNLLANAVKFTSEGGVTLRAHADRALGVVAVVVSDTGIGIAADQRDAIFEAFRQADASTTRRFGGTGLGLSIARSLAEAMGGGLTVDSVEGSGSTFTLHLPLAEAESATIERNPVIGETASLLIVERNPIFCAMYRTLLQQWSGELAFVEDADQAVAALTGGSIRRALVSDGAIVTDTERSIDLACAFADHAVRAVFLWPEGRDGDHDLLLAAGAAAVLAKPVPGDAVLAALGAEEGARALVSRAA